jgi:hypothetical protein
VLRGPAFGRAPQHDACITGFPKEHTRRAELSRRAPFERAVNKVAGTTQLANLTGDALLPTPSLGSFAGKPAGQVAKHACAEHKNDERNKTD